MGGEGTGEWPSDSLAPFPVGEGAFFQYNPPGPRGLETFILPSLDVEFLEFRSEAPAGHLRNGDK